MKEKTKEFCDAAYDGQLFYCPQCSRLSLLKVSPSLYKCILCSPRQTEPVKRQGVNDWPFVLLFLLLLFLLLSVS